MDVQLCILHSNTLFNVFSWGDLCGFCLITYYGASYEVRAESIISSRPYICMHYSDFHRRRARSDFISVHFISGSIFSSLSTRHLPTQIVSSRSCTLMCTSSHQWLSYSVRMYDDESCLSLLSSSDIVLPSWFQRSCRHPVHTGRPKILHIHERSRVRSNLRDIIENILSILLSFTMTLRDSFSI